MQSQPSELRLSQDEVHHPPVGPGETLPRLVYVLQATGWEKATEAWPPVPSVIHGHEDIRLPEGHVVAGGEAEAL